VLLFAETKKKYLRPGSEPQANGCRSLVASIASSPTQSTSWRTSRPDCAVKVSANGSREFEIVHGRVPSACIGDPRLLREHFPHADERAHSY
jgi:hypothetical protein